MKFGLIAGNGKFPFMVVEGARRSGVPLVVAAIREETDPEMDQRAERVKWVGIGQLGRMIRFFKGGCREGDYGGAGEARSDLQSCGSGRAHVEGASETAAT